MEDMSEVVDGSDPRVQIFSSTKYEIMLLLKAGGGTDLESLSKKLGVSQMAVYKHLRELEKDGLVEHVAKKNGVGRPRMFFRPTPKSSGVYPTDYVRISLMVLEYVEERLGREGLEDVARRIQDRAVGMYAGRVGDGTLYQRTKKLASTRDEHGFFGEVRTTEKGAVELIHHNCPIACFASKYPALCEQERMMIQKVLNAKVERLSSDPSGTEPCRFVISAAK